MLPVQATYVLPLRWNHAAEAERAELTRYLEWLTDRVEQVLVVDGSPVSVFEANAGAWSGLVKHVAPDPDLHFQMGKVDGVVTGLRLATFEKVVIGDDDVRYDDASLARAIELLDEADVVRPQNFFTPQPWHALWDTARTLLNRSFGADYPGTLALTKDALGPGGYDGDVLFENLELLRTAEARGGRIASPLDLYVARRPPTTRHFWSQRIRQAYDDFAILPRMALWLSLGPLTVLNARRRKGKRIAAAAGVTIALAEVGRRRAGGRAYFSPVSSLLAPLWVGERAVTSWLALGQRLTGGCRYGGGLIPRAAHSRRFLRRSLR